MKKLLLIMSVVLILLMTVASPVSAKGMGAVKVDMVVHTDSGTIEMPAGTVVGSVILNTTANGRLIVVVNLDDAVKGVYDSLVHINGVKILDQVAVDYLKVNAKGQGTANYKVDLSTVDSIPDGATEISVSVVVRPSFSPNTTPCYVNGPNWKTVILVPMK